MYKLYYRIVEETTGCTVANRLTASQAKNLLVLYQQDDTAGVYIIEEYTIKE